MQNPTRNRSLWRTRDNHVTTHIGLLLGMRKVVRTRWLVETTASQVFDRGEMRTSRKLRIRDLIATVRHHSSESFVLEIRIKLRASEALGNTFWLCCQMMTFATATYKVD